MPAGRVKRIGLTHMVTAISARIGTNTLAVAVLEAMLVMPTVITVKITLTNQAGKLVSFILVSCKTSREESPELCRAFARANPPPRRKRTPQHIFVSISLHVIREGEFLKLSPPFENGQK